MFLSVFKKIFSYELSQAQVVLFFIFAFTIIKAGFYPSSGILGGDFLWHIEYAKYMLANHAIPSTDWLTWSMPGAPYRVTQWGGQLLVGLPYIFGGYDASAIATAIVTGFILLFSWKTAYLYLNNAYTAFAIVIIGISPVVIGLTARPQIYGFLCFAILVWLYSCWQLKQEKSALLAIPFVMIAWVNLHGSYAVGVLYIAAIGGGLWISSVIENKGDVFAALREHRNLAVVSFLSIFATLINPYGFHAWEYVIHIQGLETTRNLILEWKSTSLSSSNGIPYFLVSVLIFILMYLSEDKKKVSTILGFVGAFYFGLKADRQTTFALIAMVPFFALSILGLPDWVGSTKLITEFKNVANKKLRLPVAILLIIPICFASINLNPFTKEVVAASFEVIYGLRPINFLIENDIQGRIMNSTLGEGGYLESIGKKAFIDGRLDLFEDEMTMGYVDAFTGKPGWDDYLKKYDPQILILRNELQLKQILLQKENFIMVYEDQFESIFLKNEPVYQKYIQRFAKH